ncbi:unnamed protein product [Aphanomyces euteiches]
MEELSKGVTKSQPLGLTLGFFKRFIEIHGGRDAFENLTTGAVCARFLLPYTASSKLSLVEHVRQQPDGHLYAKPATWFVSHAWSYPTWMWSMPWTISFKKMASTIQSPCGFVHFATTNMRSKTKCTTLTTGLVSSDPLSGLLAMS